MKSKSPESPKKSLKSTKSMAAMQISEGANTKYENEGCLSGCCSTPKGVYRLRLRGIVTELDLSDARKRQIDRNLLHHAGESQANAMWSQSWGMRLNMVMLWFGIIVSALIVVQHSQQVDTLNLQDTIFWILIIFSLLNNVATGTQQLFNFFDVAKTHEEAFAKMDNIAWSYFMNTGEFENLTHEDGFSLFAKKIIEVKFEESENLRNAKNKGREAAEATMKENEEKANKKLKTYQKEEDDDTPESTPPRRRSRSRRQSRRGYDDDDEPGPAGGPSLGQLGSMAAGFFNKGGGSGAASGEGSNLSGMLSQGANLAGMLGGSKEGGGGAGGLSSLAGMLGGGKDGAGGAGALGSIAGMLGGGKAAGDGAASSLTPETLASAAKLMTGEKTASNLAAALSAYNTFQATKTAQQPKKEDPPAPAEVAAAAVAPVEPERKSSAASVDSADKVLDEV